MSRPVVSSTPILRTTLIWSALATVALALIGAVIGFLVAGVPGLWSALAGVLLAAVFLSITGLSILIANRWYGDPLYVPLFFGIVLGGWILKLVIFVVLMIILRQQAWIVGPVFFLAVVAGVLTALAIDIIVIVRMRIPHVSDVNLPEKNPEDESSEAPGN